MRRARFTLSLNPGKYMTLKEYAENAEEASREYRRRIGGGNLASYVECLEVNASRK